MFQKKILRKLTILSTSIILIMGSVFYFSCNFLDIDPYITFLFPLDTVFAQK